MQPRLNVSYLLVIISVLHFLVVIPCTGLFMKKTKPPKNEGNKKIDATKVIELSLNSVKTIIIIPGETTVISIHNIPDAASYIVFQTHSHTQNITVSSDSQSQSMTRRDAGLVTLLNRQQTSINYYVYITSIHSPAIELLVLATWHKKTDPVPGACNQEFHLEIDANLLIKESDAWTTIYYQFGNKGSQRGGIQPDCESADIWSSLHYDLYVYYLGGSDYSESGLFSALKKMMTASNVQTYGTKFGELYRGKGLRPKLSVAAFNGLGTIYSLLITYNNGDVATAAYVPITTYHCTLSPNADGCQSQINIPVLVLTSLFGLLGLIMCFGGHRYFQFQQFMMGFLTFMLVAYIVIAKTADLSTVVCVLAAAGCGVVGALIWFSFWWCCGIYVFSVLLSGLVMGYLTSSMIFYTPLGNLSIWEVNFNYGMSFACGVLIIPVIFLYFTKFLSIFACALIGSYLSLITASILLHSMIHHIVLHAIYKATLPGYMKVKIYPPFQKIDIILVGIWVCLVIIGVLTQYIRDRNRPAFPECPRQRRNQRNIHRAQFSSAERQPLLIDFHNEAEDDIQQGISHAFPNYGTAGCTTAPPAYTPIAATAPCPDSPPPPYHPTGSRRAHRNQSQTAATDLL